MKNILSEHVIFQMLQLQ